MPEVSQGSSLLATLGFIAESLWDSRSLASIKIRVRCSVPSRIRPSVISVPAFAATNLLLAENPLSRNSA